MTFPGRSNKVTARGCSPNAPGVVDLLPKLVASAWSLLSTGPTNYLVGLPLVWQGMIFFSLPSPFRVMRGNDGISDFSQRLEPAAGAARRSAPLSEDPKCVSDGRTGDSLASRGSRLLPQIDVRQRAGNHQFPRPSFQHHSRLVASS